MKLENNKGYSLIEILASVMLLSVCILMILKIQTGTKHSVALSKQYREAVLIAENYMELLHQPDMNIFNSEEIQSFLNTMNLDKRLPNPEVSYDYEYINGGCVVSVAVSWGQNKKKREYTLKTIISDRIKKS